MFISIAVCTHNRFEDLCECIDALTAQLRGKDIEVLIVDSFSSDDIAHDIKKYADRAGVRVVRLTRAGVSVARNAAIAGTSGEWIVFLDDDTVPFPNYVSQLLAEVSRLAPTVGYFGGRMVPRWPHSDGGRDHIGARWRLLLSIYENDRVSHLSEDQPIFGGNLGIRRAAIAMREPFREDLGRVQGCLLSGEESELRRFLQSQKWDGWYLGSVAAEHKITPERMTRKWIRRRAYWEGVSQVIESRDWPQEKKRHLSLPKLIASIFVLSPMLVFFDPKGEFCVRFFMAWGSIAGKLWYKGLLERNTFGNKGLKLDGA